MKNGSEILKEVLDVLGENYNSFATSIGLKRTQNLYDIRDGKVKKLSNGLISLITKAYPKVNEEYLKTGIGNILKENTNLATSDQINKPDGITPIPYEDYMMVEYEDLATAAGYLGVDDLSVLPETKKRLVPKEFERGKYLVVRVDGHSMDDGTSISIPHGTEILIKELKINSGERLPIRNNLFVIVSKDGVVLKQITEHNIEEGYIKCHSYNPAFKDYIIPISEINQVFIYRKIVSFRPPIPDIEK